MSINPGTIKTLIAATAVAQYRAVKFGPGDEDVAQADAVGNDLIGVNAEPADVPAGSRIDVTLDGLVEIEAGATFARGVDLTVDAQGRAVASGAATDAKLGKAWDAANAAGDIVRVKLNIR